MKTLSELLSAGTDVLTGEKSKHSAALAAVLLGAGKDPLELLSEACKAYDKEAEEKAKAEAEAKAKAEAEAKAKAEAEAKAKAEAEAKAQAKELRRLLQSVVDQYNDPYPREEKGYGYVRDASGFFLSNATDELVFSIFHTPIRHNRWRAAAYRGWEVVAEEDGKESYRKADGSQPSDKDFERAFDLMCVAPIAYYWQYKAGHNKHID